LDEEGNKYIVNIAIIPDLGE